MTALVINVTTNASQDSGLQYVWSTFILPSTTNPGAGYVIGDILALVGGSGTPATLRVASIGANGAVTGVAVVFSGAYATLPSMPANTTGGTGTGCKLKNQYATIADMMSDFALGQIKDFRVQWKNAQRAVVSGAVESASATQLANCAADLSVTLP